MGKNSWSPGTLSGERGKQHSESRVMVHIQEACMSESGDDSSWIPCHCAWGQFLIPEEVGEKLHDQVNRGSDRIYFLYTTPSTENEPFSVIDGLCGQRLGGCNSLCCLPGESGLTKRSPDCLQACSCSLPGFRWNLSNHGCLRRVSFTGRNWGWSMDRSIRSGNQG